MFVTFGRAWELSLLNEKGIAGTVTRSAEKVICRLQVYYVP